MNKIYPLGEVDKLQTNNKSSRRSFYIKCLIAAGISIFSIICFVVLLSIQKSSNSCCIDINTTKL